TPVCTVRPFHTMSCGSPTFTDSSRGILLGFLRRESCYLKLCVHPFDPLSAGGGGHKWIRKVLRFSCDLVALELHDAHGIGRLAVVCQDEFGDPKLTAANDSSDRKPFFVRLIGALVLYVGSTAGSLA